MGRQILEALVFLKERGFPTVTHLHSGNVVVQNGVARLAGLENTLLGFTSRTHTIITSRLAHYNSMDTICFGIYIYISKTFFPLFFFFKLIFFIQKNFLFSFQVTCSLKCAQDTNYVHLNPRQFISRIFKNIHKYFSFSLLSII